MSLLRGKRYTFSEKLKRINCSNRTVDISLLTRIQVLIRDYWLSSFSSGNIPIIQDPYNHYRSYEDIEDYEYDAYSIDDEYGNRMIFYRRSYVPYAGSLFDDTVFEMCACFGPEGFTKRPVEYADLLDEIDENFPESLAMCVAMYLIEKCRVFLQIGKFKSILQYINYNVGMSPLKVPRYKMRIALRVLQNGRSVLNRLFSKSYQESSESESSGNALEDNYYTNNNAVDGDGYGNGDGGDCKALVVANQSIQSCCRSNSLNTLNTLNTRILVEPIQKYLNSFHEIDSE